MENEKNIEQLAQDLIEVKRKIKVLFNQ